MVLRAPGINCDVETVAAWEMAGARADQVHVKRLTESPALLDDCALLTIPGGFSYGDDIASGKVLANRLSSRIGNALLRFVDRGGSILGICNGFQVLVRMGLLPGSDAPQRATITVNESGRYEDRWVRCRAASNRCVLLDEEAEFYFPVAHGEGRIVVEEGRSGFDDLHRQGRVAMTYVSESGADPSYPENPNGSIGNAAGLTDGTGRVLGLMPHPERNLFAWQSPRSRGPNGDFNTETDGARFFRGIVERLG